MKLEREYREKIGGCTLSVKIVAETDCGNEKDAASGFAMISRRFYFELADAIKGGRRGAGNETAAKGS